ncbi:MAG: fibronectin type III domain-containing protein [Deltaproteobacteria bacterium]|nr:fibronectin type III domain-containing protein [Deltaproteobacteria bacterium]
MTIVYDKKNKRRLSSQLFGSLLFLVISGLLIVGAVTNAYASQVSLAWAPSDNPDVLFYKVFYRRVTQSFNYNSPAWVGTRPACTISSLDEATAYCFVVRAVDINGNESNNSNEACWAGSDGSSNTMLVDLLISGPSAVYENSVVHYRASASFTDGSIQLCTKSSTWSEESRYGTISGGMFIVSSVSGDKTTTIYATYTFGDVTKSSQKVVTILDDPQPDSPPQEPTMLSPYGGAEDISLVPELCVAGYFDPNEDFHLRTHWQVSTKPNDFSEEVLAFEVNTDSHLTSLIVPRLVLDEESTYYWRVKFCDSVGDWSRWSQVSSFTTQFLWDDFYPRNGIPDVQDVGNEIDMDNNGMPDTRQSHMKSVNTVEEDGQIGVRVDGDVSIVAVESFSLEELAGPGSRPDEMPLGAIGFKLKVPEPGDSVKVDVFLSEPAPADANWYKFDCVNGWEIHHLTVLSMFSDDRTRITLLLEDGGYGDADGVRNGVIVDPGGVGRTYSSTSPGSGGGGGGGGGCFLLTVGAQ